MDKTMQPGRLYMIGLTGDAPVIRFKKKEGAPLLTSSTSVTVYSSDVATDANWNGIANPALFSAFVNAGATIGQVYNANSESYNPITLSATKLIPGMPVFVQAPAAKTVTVSYGGTYAAAPRRANATEDAGLYDVRIAPAGANYTDRVFVRMDADKESNQYTIGQDLVKMGVSTKVAQMWINRYDAKLCMNTMAPANEVAEYPLGIYVPDDGEYTIAVEQSVMSNEQALYLTCNGETVWNLSNGAYTANLKKGTDVSYGLRIGVKKVATDINAAIVDSKDAVATKVLMNNQVFIIRGDKVYSIDGQLVK